MVVWTQEDIWKVFILRTLLIRCRVGRMLLTLAGVQHPLNYGLPWERPALEKLVFFFAWRASVGLYNSWKCPDSRIDEEDGVSSPGVPAR